MDAERWGLSIERIEQLPGRLRQHWAHYRANFRTRTHDTSEQAYASLQGQLTMEQDRHFAGIARQMNGQDGQALQHFMSNSPWSAAGVYRQIQADIGKRAELAKGSLLILDESADEKSGIESAGALRQYNGRLGKVDESQVSVVLGYANWKQGPWPTWAIVDSELFLPQQWFSPDFAAVRQEVGVPEERQHQTKPELGLVMIRRAKARQLPFEAVACDDLYGRDSHFRAELAQAGMVYYADVPANTQVYLQPPEIGIPQKASQKGRPPSQPQVLNGVTAQRADRVAQAADTHWQRLFIRHNERGVLADDFAARRVWTWQTGAAQAREEWLIVRIERNGDPTYLLSNAPPDTPLQALAEGSCGRYFVERAIEDGKDELGWDEFQAQKYQGWAHHTALTACALVNTYQFIAFEDLSIVGMQSQGNKVINRGIADVAWNQFVQFTTYKAEGAGRGVVRVDPKNTTQLCSGCGEMVPKDLSVRKHDCPHCGLKLGRDQNAALNILARGLASLRLRSVEATPL